MKTIGLRLGGLVLLLAVLVARADVRSGFGPQTSNFYPIDTYFSDSRFQFIIPMEEVRLETGELISGLSLYLVSSAGFTIDQLSIRLKSATQTDLDSMALGRFVNGGLTLCRQASSTVPTTPGWVNYTFTAGFTATANRDLLVDVVMNKSTTGTDSYWSVVSTSEPCLRYGVANALPSFNLLGQTTGFAYVNRPLVMLKGAMRLMPATVVNASQLSDPDGKIHADWKVEGRRTTIRPGVTLDFAEGYGLELRDSFRALGTETDSIRFTGENWDGVVSYTLPGTAQVELDYCVVENTRSGTSGISIQGTTADSFTMSHSEIRDCAGSAGIRLYHVATTLEQVRVVSCNQGIYLFSNDFMSLEAVETAHNSDTGMWFASFALGELGETSRLRRLWIHDNDVGLQCTFASLQLESSTICDNVDRGLYHWTGEVELVNCVMHNPVAPAEIESHSSALTLLGHCVMPGGLARCSQNSSSVVVLGNQVLDTDPLLDAQHRPLPGSPCIDAGSALSGLDPDLTPADIGCFWFDQSAPVATAAVDVPQDQGGRLQLVWNPSSMDLAQANGSWFYSLWRLDTLFSAARSGLPVVTTRAQAEAAMAQDEPFLWERDGSAWHYLGSVPAAQHAQYAQVVESLADRLDGQPWPTPLKVLWHAGEVLSESEVISGTSVDNVPPDSPQLLAAVEMEDGSLRLHWQPVTTGTVNGVQLAERGAVGYHVYEVPTPWAPESAGVLLGTASEPEFTLPLPVGNERRFFRVRAVDNL